MTNGRFELGELGLFVAEAVAFGWPDNTVESEDPEFANFWTTRYTNGNWRYVDLWSGSSTDAGAQFVFYKGQTAWSCTYRGGLILDEDLLDLSVEHNQIFAFLIRALRAEGDRTLPIRGPDTYVERDLQYSVVVRGDLASFLAFETIVRQGEPVYERTLLGGCFGDGVTYGTVLRA